MRPGSLFDRHANVLLLGLGLFTAVAWAVRAWVMIPIVIQGISMEPTCHDRQIAVVNKLAYRLQSPQRGDVVCLWTGKEFYIKRIIGLPGEEVDLQDGVLNVNGQSCPEGYLRNKGRWTVESGKLGPGRYAVAGDNRSLAQPQAVLVVVRKDRIVGKLIVF